MSEALDNQGMNHHIAIRVANGGYIVDAIVNADDDGFDTTTCVFSDINLMADYVKRAMMALEGDGKFEKLGPLRVQAQ